MSADLTVGYAALRRAIAGAGLTSAGAAWLAKCLDPYHDVPLVLEGIPDRSEALTIIREYKASISVTAGTFGFALGATDTWDLHVYLLPLMKICTFHNGAFDAKDGMIGAANNHDVLLGPLNMAARTSASDAHLFPYRGAIGEGWFMDDDPGNRQYTPLDPYGGLDTAGGQYRIVGAAFEVVNVTPELYVGGTATVYRVVSDFDKDQAELGFWEAAADDISAPAVMHHMSSFMQLPLDSLDNIMRMPTARQWQAREGAYCVGTLDPEQLCEFSDSKDRQPIVGFNDLPGPIIGPDGGTRCITQWNDGLGVGSTRPACGPERYPQGIVPGVGIPVGSLYSYPLPVYLNALHTVVAYFSALPAQSAFTINARFVVESIPNYWDKDVLNARVSAPLDEAALQLYAQTIRTIPAGVPVKMNPLGEWFRYIMKQVARFAPVVGKTIGMMFAGQPGSVMGESIGNVGANWATAMLASDTPSGGTVSNRGVKRRRLIASQ